MVETGNRTIKQKSAPQHILNGIKNIAMIKKKNSMVQMKHYDVLIEPSQCFLTKATILPLSG